MRKIRFVFENLNDINLNSNQFSLDSGQKTPEMKTRKINHMLTIILPASTITIKNFHFLGFFGKCSKTDTFSVVLSLQTHLLALADWLLDLLKPQLARNIS